MHNSSLDIQDYLKNTIISCTRGVLMVTAVIVFTSHPVLSQLAPAAERSFFQGAARKQALVEVARLKEIQKRHWAEIRVIPGVHGMGVIVNRETGRLIFGIVTDPEMPMPALPQVVEGIPVQIFQLPKAHPMNGGVGCEPCHNDTLPLPVEMGNSGHTERLVGSFCYFATIGFKACDLIEELSVYVTNAHATISDVSPFVCAGSAPVGQLTYHPSPADNLCIADNIIGSVLKQSPPISGFAFVFPNTVDAASIASDVTQTQVSIRDIGIPSSFAAQALPMDEVQKSGRTTGYTTGLVFMVGYMTTLTSTLYCPFFTADFVDQLFIIPLPLGGVWTKIGDSGSAILNFSDPPEVVGLHHAGATDPLLGSYGIASPIGEVMAHLDLSLNMEDCVGDCVATLVAKTIPTPGQPMRAALEFRDFILARSERGRKYIQIYYQITKEIVRILLTEPAIFLRTATLFQKNLPVIQGMTAHQQVTVAQKQIREVDTLFARYAARLPDPEMRKGIERIRRDLRNPDALREFGVRIRPAGGE
jgi:hypothetical protein